MKATGGFLAVIALILWFFAFTMETTISNGLEVINNIGLMQKQTILINTAGILFLASVVYMCVGFTHDSFYARLKSIDEKLTTKEKA